VEQSFELAAVDDLYMATWLTNFAWAKNVHLGINDPLIQKQIIELITTK
jgi:hypothetical protein